MSGLGALRRIASPPRRRERADSGFDSGVDGGPDGRVRVEERCEFCAVPLGERHGHVADVVDHRLLCVCRPCYLLFAPQGAGGGRYRGVGERVRRVGDLALAPGQWDGMQVPVDLVFFFRQSGPSEPSGQPSGEPVLLGFYPGPGGATESLLDLSAWRQVVADNPVLATVEDDVEAVLLRRHTAEQGAEVVSCHLVPIDVCYALVGVVRGAWVGLGGGGEVWRRIDAFFADLDARAVPVGRDGRAEGER